MKDLASTLRKGDHRALAKAITLIESTRPEAPEQASQLLQQLMPYTGNSLRIGISGPPGVGKSTFIEAFGTLILQSQQKLAVLAVDPSSPISGGSILGDKTRMETLSAHPRAFIRPSPSRGSLGGVARHTRETMLLCEAAGFNIILVETVGVGQSEITVASMVDIFIMLQQPHAGDELQGIKKGILELADLVVVTKADGDTLKAAQRTKAEQERALALVRGPDGGRPPVILCSSLQGDGLESVWQHLKTYEARQKHNHLFLSKRQEQAKQWFAQELIEALKEHLLTQPTYAALLTQIEADVVAQKLPASIAAQQMIRHLLPSA